MIEFDGKNDYLSMRDIDDLIRHLPTGKWFFIYATSDGDFGVMEIPER